MGTMIEIIALQTTGSHFMLVEDESSYSRSEDGISIFFYRRESLNKFKFIKFWKPFSEKKYFNGKIKHINWEISRPSPPS